MPDSNHVIEIFCRALVLHPERIAAQLLNALPSELPVATGTWKGLGPKEWGVATRGFPEPGQRCDVRSASGKVSRVVLRACVRPAEPDRRGLCFGPNVWSIAEADDSDYTAQSAIWSALIDAVSDKHLIEWLTYERNAAAANEQAAQAKRSEIIAQAVREYDDACALAADETLSAAQRREWSVAALRHAERAKIEVEALDLWRYGQSMDGFRRAVAERDAAAQRYFDTKKALASLDASHDSA